MRNGFVALGLIGVAAPALAATPLWGGIEAGMTSEQVTALYPKMETELGGGCSAKIKLDVKQGGVRQVILFVKPSGGDGLGARKRCAETVYAGLVSKYGQPTATSNEASRQLEAFSRETSKWDTGQTSVTMQYKAGPNLMTLIYAASAASPTPDISSKL